MSRPPTKTLVEWPQHIDSLRPSGPKYWGLGHGHRRTREQDLNRALAMLRDFKRHSPKIVF